MGACEVDLERQRETQRQADTDRPREERQIDHCEKGRKRGVSKYRRMDATLIL